MRLLHRPGSERRPGARKSASPLVPGWRLGQAILATIFDRLDALTPSSLIGGAEYLAHTGSRICRPVGREDRPDGSSHRNGSADRSPGSLAKDQALSEPQERARRSSRSSPGASPQAPIGRIRRSRIRRITACRRHRAISQWKGPGGAKGGGTTTLPLGINDQAPGNATRKAPEKPSPEGPG